MGMGDVYKELTKIYEEKIQPQIGIFWYIPSKNRVILDSCDRLDGMFFQIENIYTYKGTHKVFWKILKSRLSDEPIFEYDWQFFPRGRVNYDTTNGVYIVVMSDKLNDEDIKNKIKKEFYLPQNTIFKFDDPHYNELIGETNGIL